MREHAQRGFGHLERPARRVAFVATEPRDVATHLRSLAQQRIERHVDGMVVELAIVHGEAAIVGQRADHGERRALASRDGLEPLEAVLRDDEHVALLRLVAPELHRRHAGLFVRHGAQLDARAAVAVRHGFGHGVRQAAGAHVVDQVNGVGVAERPAAIDDFLRAALHLGIAALDGGEIEVRRGRTAAHRRGGAAAQADEHRRTTEQDDVRADGAIVLLDVVAAHVAEAARDHDRLVVPADVRARLIEGLLERAEIARDAGPAEFVVERRGAERTVEHDLEGTRDARGLAEIRLPGLLVVRDAQVRHRIAHQAGLGLRAAARGALIADLTTRARGRAGKRRDRGRMVVGLHLHQDVDGLGASAIDAGARIGEPALAHRALDDRGVVAIRREHTLRRFRMRVADHREERLRLRLTVDDEVRIEDLVAAMLGVRLREHHELGVVRIATQAIERQLEIVDLVIAQREAEPCIGLAERRGIARDLLHRLRRLAHEEAQGRVALDQRHFRHPVVQQCAQLAELYLRQRLTRLDAIFDAALDATHGGEAADVRDVGGLARPGRSGADARHDEQRRAGARGRRGVTRAVGQQLAQDAEFRGIQLARGVDEVDETRGDGGDRRLDRPQGFEDLRDAERRVGRSAGELQHR